MLLHHQTRVVAMSGAVVVAGTRRRVREIGVALLMLLLGLTMVTMVAGVRGGVREMGIAPDVRRRVRPMVGGRSRVIGVVIGVETWRSGGSGLQARGGTVFVCVMMPLRTHAVIVMLTVRLILIWIRIVVVLVVVVGVLVMVVGVVGVVGVRSRLAGLESLAHLQFVVPPYIVTICVVVEEVAVMVVVMLSAARHTQPVRA
jgi:hypothetical protein